VAVYDKDRDGHYNLISALHKSLRGGDPQAALYYLARMLTAGKTRCMCCAAWCALPARMWGWPIRRRWCNAWRRAIRTSSRLARGELAIAQACLYLATAPKSNAAYTAWKAAAASAVPPARSAARQHPQRAKLMKDIGYGKDYAYDHDAPEAFPAPITGPKAWPASLLPALRTRFEREILKRLEWWEPQRRERQQGG
jgi:putative ATPase